MGGNRYGSSRSSSKALNLSLLLFLVAFYTMIIFHGTAAFSETKSGTAPRQRDSKPQKSLQVTLQSCFTPVNILKNVAISLNAQADSSGSLSSMTLVRLSKQLVSLDNKRNNIHGDNSPVAIENMFEEEERQLWDDGLKNAVTCLTSSNWIESQKSLEAVVEGIKGASVISRILSKYRRARVEAHDDINIISYSWWKPLVEKIMEEDKRLAAAAEPHQLSGLKWSIDCFCLSTSDRKLSYQLPPSLQDAYDDLDLPFTIRPGFLTKNSECRKLPSTDGQDGEFTIPCFIKQVDFRTETIQTKSKRPVAERRQTAWQGDDDVPPFEYSGKSMERMPWSAVVATVRDLLHDETSHYYDGCLLNLYPDGGSGMRYHIDPEQGVVWDYETAVVSIGATRRFAFRSIDGTNGAKGTNNAKPHSFVLMDGDVTEMVRDCQDRFQHTLKTAEFKGESAPRVSLVFKKTLTQ